MACPASPHPRPLWDLFSQTGRCPPYRRLLPPALSEGSFQVAPRGPATSPLAWLSVVLQGTGHSSNALV